MCKLDIHSLNKEFYAFTIESNGSHSTLFAVDCIKTSNVIHFFREIFGMPIIIQSLHCFLLLLFVRTIHMYAVHYFEVIFIIRISVYKLLMNDSFSLYRNLALYHLLTNKVRTELSNKLLPLPLHPLYLFLFHCIVQI